VDVVVFNTARPSGAALERYEAENKEPLELGDLPPGCDVVMGPLWASEIARHDRRRLAYTIWSVLSNRLLA
jgi:hypothetical protein